MIMIIKGKSRSRITATVAILIGVGLGCIFAFLFPHGLIFLISTNSPFLSPLPSPYASANSHSNSNSHSQVVSAKCESSEKINLLKAELAMASQTNTALKKQITQLTERLQLAQHRYTTTPKKHVFVLGRQPIAGPFGTVKALRTNPTVSPDESVNPRLAKILHKIAIQRELVVALSNSNVKDMLELWFTNLKRVGVTNYLVVALDKETALFCQSNGIAVYERDPDEAIDSVGTTGGNHAVSGLKFRILREFLQLGYSVLLSDLDIIYLQNPFMYLHRDSDVESMSDGHSNMTAYGFDDVFDEASMGWARYAHTIRMWVYNSGFFYIRPTFPSIELLDRVAGRLSAEPKAWDQAVFNEELFHPSYPGYDGLHASRRTMDLYLFMNSKVLFKTVRKNSKLRMFLKPVIIHCNYHPDKLLRLKAIMQYYVHGKEDALDQFPDGSEW